MHTPTHLANHVRGAYFGPNTVGPNLRDQLKDVNFETALKKVGDHHTILALTFHLHYYIRGLTTVLEGGDLTIRDKFSYDHPPVASEAEWQQMKQTTYAEAEHFARLIEQLPEEKMAEPFVKSEYGTYLDNLIGTIHHLHYHHGQIGLLRKLL